VTFGLAAREGGERAAIVAAAAQQLDVSPATVEALLLADLAGEQPVAAPPPDLGPQALALRTNDALARGLLARATGVELRLVGNARPVVRLAKLLGLICVVRRDGEATIIDISGPVALLRRTRVYGFALGALLDPVAWCDDFALRAPCALQEGLFTLCLGPRDPLAPSQEPRRFDSKVEAALARDLARLALDWEIIREPEPLVAGDALVFPDFALVKRLEPARRFLLEVVGFWTPEYVTRKLALLRQAGVEGLILCIDEDRACGEDELPAGAQVIRYRKRIKAVDVLRIIEG
jgi:uncharacterized protein